jgi:GNAT superfamily N-acetyltransferase
VHDLSRLPPLQPEGWSDLSSAFKYYLNNHFCFPAKVVIDDQLAGIGTAIVLGKSAWLGHIIVHPSFRNRGVGRFITESLVTQASTTCETVMLISTALGKPVYEKVGFKIVGEYIFYKDGKLPEAVGVTVPFENIFRRDILSIDRMVSGEDRAELFDAHYTGCSVYLNDGKVEGFYMPSLGDGLVVANNADAGLALMSVRNKLEPRFVLPEQNLSARNFLQQYAFIEYQRGTRMCLGKPLLWQPEKIFNRIAGNVG